MVIIGRNFHKTELCQDHVGKDRSNPILLVHLNNEYVYQNKQTNKQKP